MSVDDRHAEGRRAIRDGVIGASARIEQRPDSVEVTTANGKHQRAELDHRRRRSGPGPPLAATATRHPKVSLFRHRIEISAARQQRLNSLNIPHRRGPHQRGLSPDGFPDVRVCSMSEQHFDHLSGSRAGRRHQWRCSSPQHMVRVRARVEQLRNHRRVAARAGKRKRSDAVTVLSPHVGARLNEQRDRFQIPEIGRPVQGCGTIHLWGVHIYLFCKQHTHSLQIPLLDRVDERPRPPGGLPRGARRQQEQQHPTGRVRSTTHPRRLQTLHSRSPQCQCRQCQCQPQRAATMTALRRLPHLKRQAGDHPPSPAPRSGSLSRPPLAQSGGAPAGHSILSLGPTRTSAASPSYCGRTAPDAPTTPPGSRSGS